MGCGGSRIDHGGGPPLPPRLWPVFLLRLQEFKIRRHTKESRLLLRDGKYEENGEPIEQVSRNLEIDLKEETDYEDALTDASDEDQKRRMIGQGSPSFRVYCEDDDDNDNDGGEDDHGDVGEIKNNAFNCTVTSDDDTLLSKDCCDEKKKVKRGRKMKSLRRGQAAVKNMLSVHLRRPTSSPEKQRPA